MVTYSHKILSCDDISYFFDHFVSRGCSPRLFSFFFAITLRFEMSPRLDINLSVVFTFNGHCVIIIIMIKQSCYDVVSLILNVVVFSCVACYLSNFICNVFSFIIIGISQKTLFIGVISSKQAEKLIFWVKLSLNSIHPCIIASSFVHFTLFVFRHPSFCFFSRKQLQSDNFFFFLYSSFIRRSLPTPSLLVTFSVFINHVRQSLHQFCRATPYHTLLAAPLALHLPNTTPLNQFAFAQLSSPLPIYLPLFISSCILSHLLHLFSEPIRSISHPK